MTKLKITETQIQIGIVEWANWHQQQYSALANLIHIPNQGKRSWRQGKEFKAMGLKSGFPDLFLFAPVLQGEKKEVWRSGLAIECKSEKGKLTPEQIDWQIRLTHWGYAWALARSVDEGVAILKEYLGIKL